MSDGTRLAARLWLPEDAERDPVPAILEYLPYRKGDAFAKRDTHHHPWFAGHGYAGVRVDLRGSGDSDGILLDEYLPQEQDDGLEVIAWLAEQPWCSGAVGMIGISWGGFNGLQIAARRPPALKAVISMCASDDRYADDVHYVGGCVLGVDMLSWAATMLTLTAMPPDPAAVGDGWRATWLERMERSPSMVEAWLAHQRRDDFWRQASVCEDYAAIEAPVYAVGGWADGYSNAVPRLVEGLPGPRKGLIGPWSHAFPQDGEPGPAIGFLQECKRWWDRWLKGIDNGIEREPVLRAWMQDTGGARHPPRRAPRALGDRDRPGRRRACAPRSGSSRPISRSSTAASSRPAPTPVPGAPTAARATGRPTSAPRTSARSRSTSRRSPSRSRSWASPSCGSSCQPTGRARSWPCASAAWRPTAPRCWSRAGCSTSPTATARTAPIRSSPAAATSWPCASTPSRTRSRPASACGWGSPAPTGPGPGPRPSRSR